MLAYVLRRLHTYTPCARRVKKGIIRKLSTKKYIITLT
jgi:hypothetical protein